MVIISLADISMTVGDILLTAESELFFRSLYDPTCEVSALYLQNKTKHFHR